jgi:hypothetical protein
LFTDSKQKGIPMELDKLIRAYEDVYDDLSRGIGWEEYGLSNALFVIAQRVKELNTIWNEAQ